MTCTLMTEENSNSPGIAPEKPANNLLKGNARKMTTKEKQDLSQKIAAWWYQDPKFRQPPTLGELSKELKRSPDTIRRLAAKLPPTLADYLKQIEVHSLSRYIEMMQSLVDLAAGGGKDAVSAARLLREIAKDHDKVKPAKSPEMPKHVTDAFNAVIEAKKKARESTSPVDSVSSSEAVSALPIIGQS